MHIAYVIRRSAQFCYGREWVLSALEGGTLTHVTDWMWDAETCDRFMIRRQRDG